MGQEVLCLIAEDLAALEQAANVCERRVMEQEKVPVAEKIISLSDSDASFIVKGGWNTVLGYRPQLQYLSDHPRAEEAFRAARDGSGSGLTRPITEVRDR
jgi:hypothetical protein